MRTMLILSLLTFGCASTRGLETAQHHAQACEQQLQRDQSPATAQACAAWREQVAIEQSRLNPHQHGPTAGQRAAVGLGAYAAGMTAAGTPAPAVNCTGDTTMTRYTGQIAIRCQ